MRHKQRPVKSSRHKSVTFIMDSPQTSFSDNNNSVAVGHQHHHHINNNNNSQHIHNTRNQQQQQTKQQQVQSSIGNLNRVSIIAANEEPVMRKQFEHNIRHMSDVMRLAFLENNDICPETWTDIDFNSLSTASILQRNIQQQLQQQRREQLQLKMKQQQQQQQQLSHQHHLHHHHHHHQQQQQELSHDYNDYDVDDYDVDMSDNGIFATATPGSSSSINTISSTPKASGSSNRRGARVRAADAMPPPSPVAPRSAQSNKRDSAANYPQGFMCDEPDCGKSFPSLRKLRHHKVVHSDEFPFVCEFRGCNKKFKRKFGIDLHSTTHFDLDPGMFAKTSNNSSLPFFGRRMQYSMCKPCGQKFKTVHEYQYHMLKHGKEPFKCPVKGCGQTFSIWKSFQKHRASHYFNYYCKMDSRCDHHTSNLQLLKLHIYCCHYRRKLPENATLSSKDRDQEEEESSKDAAIDVTGEEEFETMQVSEEPGPPSPPPPAPQPSQSHRQQQKQQQQQQQQQHTQQLQSPEPPQPSFQEESINHADDEATDKSTIDSTPRRKNPPRSSRNIISTFGTPKSSPVKEERSPSSKRNVKAKAAEITPPSPVTPRQVAPSRRETAANYSQGFLCDEPDCGKSFPSLRKLRHHKVVHSDEFPFVCEFRGCNKKFKRKFGIDLHSTTHFDLDPGMFSKTSNNSSLPFFGRRMQYSMCKPCGQKFKTVHEYQYHMLKHGKEPFKCPVKGCGQTFSIWKSFQKHRASHYFNYYCQMDPQCDHHTTNLQLLKLHIYCCHFRRKLPENATLSSKDRDHVYDEPSREIPMEHESSPPPPPPPAPRSPSPEPQLQSRSSSHPSLRKNPRRSSRAFSPKPTSTTPKKETKEKLPLKVLPKRGAQRLPMSLIAADDGSTDDGQSTDSYQNDEQDDDNQDQDPDDESSGKARFKCHLCDYKFSVRFQLTKHLSTHLELTPDMYAATADVKVIQLSERRRREFYCDKCNVKYEQMSDLDNHMRKHGQRPYSCNFCQIPSTFRLAKQYLSHLYEHRFNYRCTMKQNCNFTINRKDALKLHIFRMHLNQQLPSYIENYANMVDCNEWSEQ